MMRSVMDIIIINCLRLGMLLVFVMLGVLLMLGVVVRMLDVLNLDFF